MLARLIPLTEDARRALGDESHVGIERLPVKVGRESRTTLTRLAMSVERRLGLAPPLNDVYLVEPMLEQFMHVSREHFLIEQDEHGTFFLTDRGSACGTIVAGKPVGGNRTGGRIELHDNDVIVIGTASSPYVFRFRTG